MNGFKNYALRSGLDRWLNERAREDKKDDTGIGERDTKGERVEGTK
jgi:hypothetical protein